MIILCLAVAKRYINCNSRFIRLSSKQVFKEKQKSYSLTLETTVYKYIDTYREMRKPAKKVRTSAKK